MPLNTIVCEDEIIGEPHLIPCKFMTPQQERNLGTSSLDCIEADGTLLKRCKKQFGQAKKAAY
jgi:hypothetical protein